MSSSEAANAASSHQEQREQKVLDVMFLCDEWKSSKGGLSTFNREFAINLAEATTGSMKIHCYVSNSDDRDREDAEQHGVNLITARSVPGSADPLECLKFPPSKLPKPHLVIGHGRKLGSPAYSLVQITKCKWIQFVHVYCEDLGKYKESATAAEDTIEENEKKHKIEIELCKAADAVVAVGSRLQQKYSRRLLNVEVKIITPGIFGKFSNESKLAVDRSVVKNFNVSLFGRAAFEDLSLKGYDVVANAIGSLGKNFELTFVGSSPGEQRKVEQWFLDNTCINRNQLTIRRYCSEQEELKVMFYQSDLVALPSRTEGFGLVALEAISAGVPVLVSGESGIAEALQKVEGGNTVIVGSGEDKDEWARRIREMYEESAEEREVNAVKLRENYRKVYSWKEECERFKGLIENVVKTANGGEMNIKVDVNYLKPKEQNMQTGMLATETVRCQEVILPRVSGTSAASGSASCPQTEDLHTRKEEIFLSIILNYFNTIKPQSIEEFNRFMEYAEKMRFIITGVSKGSLVMTVRCESLMILEDLWTDYSSGHLDEVVQNCFVTEEILKELNLAELRLKTTIDIEEYNACKMFFEKDALRDALSSEFHSTSSTSESPQKKEQWEKSEQKTKIMETAKLEDQKLNIKVDVEHMKRADQDAYNTASVLALEPAGYQKASTASGTKRKRHSDADLEDPQLLKKKVLCLIAMNYLDTTPAQSRDERNEFKEYLQEMKVFIIGVSVGSLVITVKCDSLSSLEELWEDYSCGLLDKMVRDCFVTEKIMKELNLAELKLKTTMDIEEYNAYKLYFLEKDALGGASSSEFHSISSPSESPQNQEELKKWKQKTKIDEKGTSPLTVIPTTGHGKELIGKAQGRKVTSWIVTTLFEATIDLLINKDRDKAAEILKDGDVTGQRFRSLIVRELDDIKSKLDVFLRRDLQASFSFFEEGIALLYEVFDIVESRNELGAATTQVARDDTFSLVEGIRRLELTGLDESVTRKLYTAKERFKDARREATRAFKNEGLKTSDRILAMKCRVMATILEKVDNPSDALAPCGVCVKELNSLSAVQNSFDVQFKTGIQKVRGLFGKEERREIIFNVCHVNRVIFDFALALGRLDFNLSVDIGENKVIPLCDARVKDLADRHGKEYCCVPLKPFGQRGKEEHKLKHPMAIATNSSGEFIITDLHHVKVFDNSGNFVKQSSLSTDEANRTFAFEVATDMSDNIFVLIELEKPRSELSYWVYKLTKTADLHHAFRLRGEGKYRGLSVSDKGKVVTLRGANTVEEYDTDGEFVRSFGLGIISSARDIIVANDGLVMVLGDYYVHIFSESGDYLDKFKLQQRDCDYTCITFHRAGEQVVAAGILARNLLQVEIYSKDGEFVYCAEIAIDGWFRNLRKITLTTKGRIACVADGKVFIF